MISIIVFTYRRRERLIQCLKSIDSKNVIEILLFNDDETEKLDISDFDLLDILKNKIKIYNPSDFGFSDRAFRKPIYINIAVELAKCEYILFSDDDGIFVPGSIDIHRRALKNYKFCAGSIVRSRFLNRMSKSILQGTNYSFDKNFFKDVGGYDETFVQTNGGGDIDFWYRIYQYVQINKIPVAYIPKACQKVTQISKRKKKYRPLGYWGHAPQATPPSNP